MVEGQGPVLVHCQGIGVVFNLASRDNVQEFLDLLTITNSAKLKIGFEIFLFDTIIQIQIISEHG